MTNTTKLIQAKTYLSERGIPLRVRFGVVPQQANPASGFMLRLQDALLASRTSQGNLK